MTRATTHLRLVIDVDSDPISGSVCNGHDGAQPFTGWIELVGVIEAARSVNDPWEAPTPSGDHPAETLGSLPGANPGNR